MRPIHEILKKYWGYDSFRKGQEEIINSVLEKKDTLALLPTGAGKSITYQVPALALEGICLVVTPLIALMKDQVSRLNKLNIKALAIFSGMNYHEIEVALDNAVFGDYKFLYISPERIETDIFKTKVKDMNVNLIAVDEAHCISQWGYDFRPSYLNIKELRTWHHKVPILALTATATVSVANDIQEKLEFRSRHIIKTSFFRENLVYVVRNMEDKNGYILESLNKLKGCGIIYVRNRKKTKELALFLKDNGISADFYHAGLKHELRNIKQEDWMTDKIRVMCTTNAFGMGIDKPDVRFVLHYDVPDSLEEYYQEAGRAGRDRKKSYAVLLCNQTDFSKMNQRMAVKFPEIKEIKRVYNAICNYFQIPIGSGKKNVYDFNIAEFCSSYKLQILKTYNCLKTLEKEGYIEITDDLDNPSRIMFIVNRDDLYKFQVENKSFDSFIKLMLRSYTGLFNNYVAIDELALSRKSKLKSDEVYQYLLKLSKLKIINYIPQKKTPLIIFTEERLEDKAILISPKSLKERKERYEDRMDQVIGYAKNNDICRSQYLVNYFGENSSTTCGSCDVCLKEISEGLTNHEFNEIMNIILNINIKEGIDPEEISKISPYDRKKNIEVIRILLDQRKITYNDNMKIILNN